MAKTQFLCNFFVDSKSRAQELSNDVSFVIFELQTWDLEGGGGKLTLSPPQRILVFKYPGRERVKKICWVKNSVFELSWTGCKAFNKCKYLCNKNELMNIFFGILTLLYFFKISSDIQNLIVFIVYSKILRFCSLILLKIKMIC